MKLILWPPALLFYVDSLGKASKLGVTRATSAGFTIRIVKKYKKDKGLVAHELIHVKRWWLFGMLIHQLLYSFCGRYRLNTECEAYAKQWIVSKYDDSLMDNFVTAIETCYRLEYDRFMIRKTIDKYIYRINHGRFGLK